MNARIVAVPAAALFLALSMFGCSSAESVEETAEEQEGVGVRPVDPSTGQPVNPITRQPVDDYPLGYCVYVCSLSKRWVPMANHCKSVGVCDPDALNQECTQERTMSVLELPTCPKEVKRSCVNPNFPAP
jgi:hypothetical protein